MAQKICWDICPRTLSVPRSEQFSESVARGKLSFEEQIMSKDKYASIFLCQMEVCVYYPSNIFFATRAGLQFVEYFSWGIFGRVMRLDQSRGRENISWITSSDILHPFRKANNFLRAKFEEYCELFGRDNVKGQISEHTFPPNGSYLLYHPSNTFRNMHGLENWRICISYNPPINFRVILLATLRHVV